jgi:hypothetical protein
MVSPCTMQVTLREVLLLAQHKAACYFTDHTVVVVINNPLIQLIRSNDKHKSSYMINLLAQLRQTSIVF